MATYRSLKAGVTVRNVREPEFDVPDGGEALRLERQARAGLSYAFTPSWLVAADVDLLAHDDALGDRRDLALGVEGRLAAARDSTRRTSTQCRRIRRLAGRAGPGHRLWRKLRCDCPRPRRRRGDRRRRPRGHGLARCRAVRLLDASLLGPLSSAFDEIVSGPARRAA